MRMSPKWNAQAGLFTFLILLSGAALAAPVSDLEMLEAVKHGDYEAVQTLLAQDADVNAAQGDGSTALAWAVHRNDEKITDLLIRSGADVNASNGLGVTPLSLACGNASPSIVQKLLAAGANPNTAVQSGETPLMTCARTGNAEAVAALLAHGADASARETRRGQTALMWAVSQKHAAAARALIAGGADVEARSDGGFTPLMFAARVGDRDSAAALLGAGADVNQATPNDGTALVVAASSGHERLAVFLLEKGADPNAANASGATALHFAALQGLSIITGIRYALRVDYLFRDNMPELAKKLLERGANPNARITRTPEEFSALVPWVDPVGATPFLLAAASQDLPLMRLLAGHGADPRLSTKDGTSPLMAAAGIGQVGPGNQVFFRGRPDLGPEVEQRALAAVKLAVELGADVNAADATGQTPLHAAAYSGANSIIQFLVDSGARADVEDSYGMTPLSIAEGVMPKDLTARLKRPRVPNPNAANLLRQLSGKNSSD